MKKKRYNILILLCLLLVCFLQCRKKGVLPDETQEGKGTFGCTIDGGVFTPKGSL